MPELKLRITDKNQIDKITTLRSNIIQNMDTRIKRKEIAAGLTAQLRITDLMELNIGCVLQAVSRHRASLKSRRLVPMTIWTVC